MIGNPLISICIPAYSAALFIADTINDWTNQSYKNLQIIIQDDCSTDDTYEIAVGLAKLDGRISVFRNIENLGIGKNWNEAYSKAKGDYIVIANADDIYHSEFIQNAVSIFSTDAKIDSISFRYLRYQENTKISEVVPIHSQLNTGVQENLFELCFFHNPYHIIFSVFKKTSLNRIMVDEKLFLETQICDAELFFRIGKSNFYHYFDDYIAGKYRKHPDNNSLKPNGESHSWLFDVFPLYKDYLQENFKKATLRDLRKKILHEIKYSIRNKRRLQVKSIFGLLKNYLRII